jgi:hypothetical protein
MPRRKKMRLIHSKNHQKSISFKQKIPKTYRSCQPRSEKSSRSFPYESISYYALSLSLHL